MQASTLSTPSTQDGGSSNSGTRSSLLLQENIARLSVLAEDALLSPDPVVRHEADRQLLALSSYDNWAEVKNMLPRVTNNCLRFVVCKAVLFIVCNEIGPEERSEVQGLVLEYLRSRMESGEELPAYIKNQLYLILATALFGNWKISVIRQEQGSQSLAQDFIDQIGQYLPPVEILACLSELINVFSQQYGRMQVTVVASSYCNTIAPYIFGYAARYLSELPARAISVCCAAMESLPATLVSMMGIVRLDVCVEDPTVTLVEWQRWAEPVRAALAYCTATVLRDPFALDSLTACGRLVRLISAIKSPQESFMMEREVISAQLLAFAAGLVEACKSAGEAPTEVLTLACSVTVNTFERDAFTTVSYFERNLSALQDWVAATRFVIDRFADDEEDLRRSLMHFFYLVANHMLKSQRRRDPLDRPLTRDPRGEDPGEWLADRLSKSQQSSFETGVRSVVLEIFRHYFGTVLRNAPVSETSLELRSEEGLMVHTEKLLYPLAEMLYCERVQFIPFVLEQLRDNVRLYFRCVSVRESLAMGEPDAATQQRLAELSLSVMLQDLSLGADEANPNASSPDGGAAAPSVPAWGITGAAPLFLMHVILSRLAVIISIVSIAIGNRTSHDDDEVLPVVLEFATNLLDCSSLSTGDLLQCLTLDDSADQRRLFSGADPSPEHATASVHIGVLRALFFFCYSLCESNRDTSPELTNIALLLLQYVYLNHSNVACLVVDANALLTMAARGHLGGPALATSDRLGMLLSAVEEDRIDLLQARNLPSLGPDDLVAREGMLTAMAVCAEARLNANMAHSDFYCRVAERCVGGGVLQHYPAQAFADLNALMSGTRHPEAYLALLSTALSHEREMRQLIRGGNRKATEAAITWLATVSVLGIRLLGRNSSHELSWMAASLMLYTLTTYYAQLSTNPASMEGGAFAFPADPAEGEVVYEVADILQGICSNTWCLLGVLMHYERATVERLFCGSVQLFLAVPVPKLLSDTTKQGHLLSCLLILADASDRAIKPVHAVLTRLGLWRQLLRKLTQVLNYRFSIEALRVIYVIVRNSALQRPPTPGPSPRSPRSSPASFSMDVDSESVGQAFNEVLVCLVSTPYLENNEIVLIFNILAACYAAAPGNCEYYSRKLLDFASAYHRVRIRMVSNLIIEGNPQAAEQYVTVFGQSTKVPTLAAW